MKPYNPVVLILCLAQSWVVWSYPGFQKEIPNGAQVPNPCGDDIWEGVGHENIGGGGPRNPFGRDFEKAGEKWTAALCKIDSDGDGRTNGQELGDPDCTWKKDSAPKTTDDLSHPGICEPMDSKVCQEKNAWLKSCPEVFDCPAFKEPGVQTVKLRLPRTRVPAQETTYMCIGFELPSEKKYHVIGDEPIIDNVNVMHHMDFFGCSSPFENPKRMTEPWECEMVYENCTTMISLWGLGKSGQCNAEEFGIPIGKGHIKYALIQYHWNNPEVRGDYFDSSGLTLYYTDKLRPNDGGILTVGQTYLEIPPRQSKVVYEGTCKKECSDKILPKSIYIASSVLHMHLLGKSGNISILRQNQKPQVINEDLDYDYNTPISINYQQHIKVNAGEEIVVRCVFNSTDRRTTTYFGEGTQDEMCYGFITYYPYITKFDACEQWKGLTGCSLTEKFYHYECEYETFDKLLNKDEAVDCEKKCTSACLEYFKELKATCCLDLSTSTGQLLNTSSDVQAIHSMINFCERTGFTVNNTCVPSAGQQATLPAFLLILSCLSGMTTLLGV